MTDVQTPIGEGGSPINEAGVDAHEAGPTCAPTYQLTDALAVISGDWLTSPTMSGYPKALDGPAGTRMVALTDFAGGQRGGFWLKQTVPMQAFDVSFDYFIECMDNAQCADGLAVAWINTTDADDLADGAGGRSLALPKHAGGAVTLTADKNFNSGHLSDDDNINAPALTIRSVTGTTNVLRVSVADTFWKARRHMALRLRKGIVTVTDGDLKVTSSIDSGFIGYFGVTAATGNDIDHAWIGAFSGSFYACDPPD